MNNFWYVILVGFFISLSSLSGLLVIKSNKKIAIFIEKRIEILSALSAGIFFFTSFAMAKHGFHTLEKTHWYLAILLGIILFIIFHKLLAGHKHKGDCEEHIIEHKKKSAFKIIIGDTIHNIADGLILVASFGTSTVLGITTSISTFLHEVPQEISEFIVLLKSGYSVREASIKNFISALSIFIGIIIGFMMMQTKILQGFLVTISSIFFFGVIFTDLFPIKKIIKKKKKEKINLLLYFLSGIIIMSIILTLLHH